MVTTRGRTSTSCCSRRTPELRYGRQPRRLRRRRHRYAGPRPSTTSPAAGPPRTARPPCPSTACSSAPPRWRPRRPPPPTSVKQLLVDTPGITRDVNGGWVGAGRSDGDVTSGRSQLGADIHEIDNAASRCGALLDQVAGDAEAAARPQGRAGRGDGPDQQALLRRRRRDDLRAVAAPLPRAASGPDRRPPTATAGSTSPSATASRSCSTAPSPACTPAAPARSSASPSTRPTRPPRSTTLVATYPEAATCLLHPADVHFFIEVCRRPGKPVNFVPVIDADVRRWWRSDSLWQAHDEAYDADQVIVIPGPVAVAGITLVDEPVADLLDRFEAAIVADLQVPRRDPAGRHQPHHRGRGHHPARRRAPTPTTWCGPGASSPTRCTASRASRPRWSSSDGWQHRHAPGARCHGDPAPARRPLRRGRRGSPGHLDGRRHRRDGRPPGAHRRRHPARGGGRHRRRARPVVRRRRHRPHRCHQPRAHPPW